MTLLSPFNQMEFSASGEAGNSLFSKKCLKPSYFSRSPLPTQSSIPFCSDIQFSHDSICPFNDQIRLWEIECCEHSAFYLASETDTFCPVQCCSVFVNSIQDLLIITSGFFFFISSINHNEALKLYKTFSLMFHSIEISLTLILFSSWQSKTIFPLLQG